MKTEAYKEGKENAQFHLDNAEALCREANGSLTIVMAAGLGALGYTASLIEKAAPDNLVVATAMVSIHLFIVAGLLVRKCLSAEDIMPITNEPRNLVHEDFEWEDVVSVEIENLNSRIDFNQARNKAVGNWLNRLRYAAFATPATFVVAYLVGLAVDAT